MNDICEAFIKKNRVPVRRKVKEEPKSEMDQVMDSFGDMLDKNPHYYYGNWYKHNDEYVFSAEGIEFYVTYNPGTKLYSFVGKDEKTGKEFSTKSRLTERDAIKYITNATYRFTTRNI